VQLYSIDCVDNTSDEFLSKDMSHLMNSELGYVLLENVDGSEIDLPVQLMNSGHHFDDIPETQHCNRGVGIDHSLPQTQLLQKVADSNMHRPPVKHRRT
jgi:hypothetical protein